MKVRKYLLICIAAISLNALTSCGGGSTQSDPLDPENPENPENPEPPAYFNPIEGEWLAKSTSNFKIIFTKDFEWQESWFENGKWEEPETKRTYKMVDEKSFKTGERTYYFKITIENGKRIFELSFYKDFKDSSILYQ